MRAAIGFKTHTGWAAAVALRGSAGDVEVCAKRRVELASGFDDAAIFHASQERPLAEAEAFIARRTAAFRDAAHAALTALLEDVRRAGDEPRAAAVLTGNPKPLPPLERILASHALVHAAEGALFQRIIAETCEALGLRTLRVPAKELAARASAALGLSAKALADRRDAMGKRSGPPWAADQKEAAVAAWVALRG